MSGWKSDQLAFRESHSIFFKIYLDVTFDSESNEPTPSRVATNIERDMADFATDSIARLCF